MSESYVIGQALITPGDGSAFNARLAIRNGRIAEILPGDGPSDFQLPPGTTIAPGIIDVHTNGAEDRLFNRDQGAAVETASIAYAAMGATAYVATVMTAPWESMIHAAEAITEAAHEIEEGGVPIGARCLGIHFEGPFLHPKFRRVHRNEWLRTATLENTNAMTDACGGALLMVTMAPEVDGVADAARRFFDQGIVCSAGHTSGRYAEGALAIGCGFRTLTHAFNGMPPLDHRDPSLMAAFIEDERTTLQVICDGVHVTPSMVSILYRLVKDRLVLATDNMPPAGAGYRIIGGVMRSEDGTIAGSALHCDQAVRNLMLYANVPFSEAIGCATRSPARLLGLEREMGAIAPGARADLSLWDDRYRVIATLVGGKAVYGQQILRRATAQAS